MGLFNLTDITFKKDSSIQSGPLAPLAPQGDSRYAYDVFRYPIDIGNYDKGHYMIFHINEQIKTQFKGTSTGVEPASSLSQRNYEGSGVGATNQGQKIGNAISTIGSEIRELAESISRPRFIENIRDGIGSLFNANLRAADENSVIGGMSGGLNAVAQDVRNNLSYARTIKQTTSTVALYMPDTLNFNNQQNYDTLSVGGTKASALIAAGSSVADTLKNGNGIGDNSANLIKNLTPMLASYFLNSVGGNLGRVLGAAGLGAVQNPMLEMIYSSPQMRSFRFDFMLYPRSEVEAQEVQKLIERFKFHQAPEFKNDSGGFFLIPPSEFDVKFYYNGKENPNIPKIQTCVLETIDVDYAPNGFSAYELPNENSPTLGRTGMPVGIRLSLQFKETEIITKQLIKSQSPTIN